jgi:hypothetical protein
MDTHSVTPLEIEAIALSSPSAATDADDASARWPTPEPAWRAITRWLVDSVLHAGAAEAALYNGVWRDPTTFPR